MFLNRHFQISIQTFYVDYYISNYYHLKKSLSTINKDFRQ